MRALFGRLPFGHRSGGASPLSPASGSQPCRALLTIAGALADWQGLFWTACAFLLVIFAYGELA